MNGHGAVLLVEEEPRLLEDLRSALPSNEPGMRVVAATSVQQALALIQDSRFAVVVTTLEFQKASTTRNRIWSGWSVVQAARKRAFETQVIIVTNAPLWAIIREPELDVDKMPGLVDRSDPNYLDVLAARVSEAWLNWGVVRLRTPIVLEIALPPNNDGYIEFRVGHDPAPRRTLNPISLDYDLVAEATRSVGVLVGTELRRERNTLSKLIGSYLYEKLFGDHAELREALAFAKGTARGNDERVAIRIVTGLEARGLPFELLHDGSEYLALCYPLTQMLDRCGRALPHRSEGKALLIAADTFSAALNPIPSVDDEVSLVQNILDQYDYSTDALLSHETHYECVAQKLREDWHLVHYAGHGEFNAECPDESKLLFWEGKCHKKTWLNQRGGDGAMTGPREIRGGLHGLKTDELRAHLERSTPWLVYLNCCYSARVGGANSAVFSASLGLLDAVRRAGVQTVIGHRWPVPDTGKSLRFVKTFYENLMRTGVPEQALLLARQDSRDDSGIWSSPVMFTQRPP